MEIKRIIIYPKDVECITGQSGRSARKMMATIREKLGKQKHQLVSIREFCDYTGVPEWEVLKHLEG